MAIDSSKRLEFARQDLEALKGLSPTETESVLQTMSKERKQAMVDLIRTIRQDLVPKSSLNQAIEDAMEHMEIGELEHMPVSKEQAVMFTDQDIDKALNVQFKLNDIENLSKGLFKFELTKSEAESVYRDYAEDPKRIFETGEWPGLKKILLQKGLSEREANIKTDAVIVHAFRIENPGADLPPFAQAA